MKILAVGAHFDDLELGCGGSLLRWRSEGHDIVGLVLTDSGYKNEAGQEIRSSTIAREEGLKAAKLTGYELLEGGFKTFGLSSLSDLNAYLLRVMDATKPDMLMTHWSGDSHIDHRAIALSSIHCARRIGKVLMYRSNWYMSEAAFQANYFVDISATFNKKVELAKVFNSEFSRTGGQWLRWLESQGRGYGMVTGTEYAEGFEVLKWTW